MARLLITGASGLLGGNLVLQAREEHEVVAASLRGRLRLDGVSAHAADLTDPEAVRRLVEDAAPDWIIHCAAATDLDACEEKPDWAFRVNRDASANLALAAGRAAFVYISTDCVFDGATGGYREEAPTAPISVYGASKLAGERAVLHARPQALVLRTNIYGWNAQPKQCLAEWFLVRTESGLRSPGWSDVTSTPILVNDLGEIVLSLLAAGKTGIYHVGGRTCLSKLEFGRRVVSTFGLDPLQIESSRLEDAGLMAPRGRDLCLDGARIERDLGIRLPSVDQGLIRFRRLREDGWVERLHAMVADSDPLPAATKEANPR